MPLFLVSRCACARCLSGLFFALTSLFQLSIVFFFVSVSFRFIFMFEKRKEDVKEKKVRARGVVVSLDRTERGCPQQLLAFLQFLP